MQSVQNSLSYLFLYGVQYKSQLIRVSLISIIKFSTFVVLQNILVTARDCESYQQNQKCYTKSQENCVEGLHTYLVHSRYPYSVVFEMLVSNRVAAPAGFTLTRMQNHNKVISASQGKGVNKMIESKYSLTYSARSHVAFLFLVQQLLSDSQPLADPTEPHGATGKVW